MFPQNFRLGYACICTKLRNQNIFSSRTLRLNTLKAKSNSIAKELATQNLKDLLTMLKWNKQNDIYFMRLSSEIFPFATHDEHGYSLDFADTLLKQIGNYAKENKMRLTMHPAQFNVLSSPSEKVVQNTIKDLNHHCDILDRMELDHQSVMIIHGGGVYGDKNASLERLKQNFKKLPENTQKRLVLENCEMSYKVEELLPVSEELKIPIVLDFHHDDLNMSSHPISHYYDRVFKIWNDRGIKPKVHVSNSIPDIPTDAAITIKRKHSDYIYFFHEELLKITFPIDVMLECKMKEQSIIQLRKQKYEKKQENDEENKQKNEQENKLQKDDISDINYISNKMKEVKLHDQEPKKILTEDFGKIMEMAVCMLYETEYDGKYKYSYDEALNLKSRIVNLKELFPYKLQHTAKGGGQYDFISTDNENINLSIKTTKKNAKVCPQVIGQPSKKNFCKYFNLVNETNDVKIIKEYIQSNIKPMLKTYMSTTFCCPIIYYNKDSDLLLFIKQKADINWNDYNIDFSHITKSKNWNESTTISINNTNIGEFQVHNKRDCVKFRWSFENLINMFNENFEINTIEKNTKDTKQTQKTDINEEFTKSSLRNILKNSKINHKEEILKKKDLKYAHIYCKINNLSGQTTGPLIEYYIQHKFDMKKNNASDCIGDLSSDKTNYEIKVSNGGKENDKFNYVQIRFNHKCDYLLTAYHISEQNIDNCGELYIFKISKENLKTIVEKHGHYAHGTIQKLGNITLNDLTQNNNKEYALRPKYNDECWKALLQFKVSEQEI